MTQAHEEMDATGDEDLLEENQLSEVLIRIPRHQHARLWQAKILRRVNIQKFMREVIENGLRGLNL